MTNRYRGRSRIGLLSLPAVLVITVAVNLSAQSSPNSAANAPTRKQPYSHELPAMDSNHLRVFVSDIEVAPGESSPPHSHPCAVIGHVAAGAFRHKVKGDPEAIYGAGEDFYEAPNGVHEVFANVSGKDPARLIAIFVCDHETKLTVPPVEEHELPQKK
ncbi:MAG: cupin domain-containing protein [Acidobacteria bacterium]|nr:MAG: cupin domain-containing protein [Acidobacteriota bacterium]